MSVKVELQTYVRFWVWKEPPRTDWNKFWGGQRASSGGKKFWLTKNLELSESEVSHMRASNGIRHRNVWFETLRTDWNLDSQVLEVRVDLGSPPNSEYLGTWEPWDLYRSLHKSANGEFDYSSLEGARIDRSKLQHVISKSDARSLLKVEWEEFQVSDGQDPYRR